MSKKSFGVVAVLAALSIVAVVLLRSSAADKANTSGPTELKKVELLNVSYDPTRELWRALNEKFIAQYAKEQGIEVKINQSHAASGSQARAVIDGLEADVVTLALWTDTDAIRKTGLIAADWEKRLPNGSVPYYSTIVFVVRKGNPRRIDDWSDVIKGDVQVITPSPKTSGNGKLSFLAAWASVISSGGSEKDAEEFVRQLYQHTPVLDSGARGATTTFAQKKIGDVHLTWENEAWLEVKESGDELEIVYPAVSIRAEPPVAWVDANVKRRGTETVARDYLEFVYSPAGQEVLAENYYRPIDEKVLAAHKKNFPDVKLVSVQEIAKGWEDAAKRFFKDGGVFDSIYQPKK